MSNVSKRKPTRRMFVKAALAAHEANYLARGDRYATADEMRMHRDDPLACYELVEENIAAMPRFAAWNISRRGVYRRD